MESDYNNPLEKQEHTEVDEFLSSIEWQKADISGNWLDPSEKYTRPRYTLSYNGVPFAPLGGIHGLTGQPGHGKTFTFTQLMVAILKGEFYGLKYELTGVEPKVLYIDTEMEKGNTQLVMLRVYEMMGWQSGVSYDQFRILWLREEVQAVERWRKTLKAIQEMKPTVVFLDGLIDVIGDFNDNRECQEIIYQCMATASHYGISLWLLLHENPGTTKMVGHAGSFLERKATDVLKTKKNKENGNITFDVAQIKARARDLDTWQFHIESGEHDFGYPVIDDVPQQDTKTPSRKVAQLPDDAYTFFKMNMPEGGLGVREMRDMLSDKCQAGHTTADRFSAECVGRGILTQDSQKRFYLNPNYQPPKIDNREGFWMDKENDDDPF